ncbi:MAG: hypothetical protein ACHREM_07240, partial [Polyangiales bacterium]
MLRTLAAPTHVRVPRHLTALQGVTGAGDGVLTIGNGATVVTCRYSSSGRALAPSTLVELAHENGYRFVSCDGGQKAGDVVVADRVDLQLTAAGASATQDVEIVEASLPNQDVQKLAADALAAENAIVVHDPRFPG